MSVPRLVLCASLATALLGGAGCATATGGGKASPARAHPFADGGGSGDQLAASDARLATLLDRRRQLTELLAAVEGKLLAAAQRSARPSSQPDEPEEAHIAVQQAVGPPEPRAVGADLPADVLELVERRLIITVALARVQRHIARRRLELGIEPAASSGAPSATPRHSANPLTDNVEVGLIADPAHADAAALLQRAELELDEARRRRAQRALADRGGWAGPGGLGGLGILGATGGEDRGLDGRFGQGGTGELDRLLEDSRKPPPRRGPRKKAGAAGHGKGGRDYLAELEGDKRDKEREARSRRVEPAVTGKGGMFFGEGGEEENTKEEAEAEDAGRRASVVAQGAPPAGVMAAVQRQLGSMLDCIPESLQAAGPVRFRVKARLGGEGRLHEPVVSSGGVLPPAVTGCLVDLLVRMRVPPTEDGASRIIGFPVWLSIPP